MALAEEPLLPPIPPPGPHPPPPLEPLPSVLPEVLTVRIGPVPSDNPCVYVPELLMPLPPVPLIVMVMVPAFRAMFVSAFIPLAV